MKTVRRLLGVMLAVGLMVSAMAVFAAGDDFDIGKYITEYSNKGGIVTENDLGGYDFYGSEPPSLHGDRYQWFNTNDGHWNVSREVWWNGRKTGAWIRVEQESDGSTEYVDPYEEAQAIAQRAEAEAVQHAASDEGFADVGDMYRAAEKNMSAGEFYNNAVVSTPGIDNVVPVGQGGGLIVNGEVTNMSATITKVVNRAYLDYVRVAEEGRVLNVVDVSYPAVEATINFYMPGVTAEDTIVAMQYNAGTWVDIEVAEIRADHVVLNMKGNGIVAFIQK
ncbi:MAG: hypothetical protein K2N43_01235 [Lachnospiraceae bacterium]|nr:hypothetical protein [Lachnospiraceae bacterium]